VLCAVLEAAGARVVRLVRRRDQVGPGRVHWDPDDGTIDAAGLRGAAAFVHLAAENVGGGRWTAARKEKILRSRIDGTTLLARAAAELDPPPRVFVSASAIGIYGDRGDEILDERSGPGKGFLAGVCVGWEAATAPAVEAGIRVVTPRIGIVLTPEGGALARMLPLFSRGLGGRLGSGKQWVSWITLGDVVGALRHAIADDRLAGPVVLAAPSPVTNAELTRVLGRVLRRPTLLLVPALALDLALGGMSELVLASARALPRRLEATGYEFDHEALEPALRALLVP